MTNITSYFLKKIGPFFILFSLLSLMFLSGFYLYYNPQLPDTKIFHSIHLNEPLKIYASNGTLIGQFGKKRTPLQYEEIPLLMKQAFINTEDKRFYSHNGVDWISLLDDSLKLLLTGKIQAGASTITMQLARNVSLSRTRTFDRKFKEILLALKIERILTKEEILTAYLNLIFMGNRAYGVEASAITYFGKTVKKLSLAEIALLAGLPKAPSALNPFKSEKLSLQRRNVILKGMLAQKTITKAMYQKAVNEPLTLSQSNLYLESQKSPYVAEYVRKQLYDKYGDRIYTEGFSVHTTIDINLQKIGKQSVLNGLDAYEKRNGYKKPPYKIDLSNSNETNWLNALNKLPQANGLIPSTIIQNENETLTVYSSKGIITIPSSSWSGWPEYRKKQLNIAQLFSTGDVIYIKENQKNQWKVAQMPTANASLIAIDPTTGAIKTMVAGFSYKLSQFNFATQSKRQPGSTFKPFIYSAALEKGISPADFFLDAPIVLKDKTLEEYYKPSNASKQYRGSISVREGFYRSINLVSMRILQKAGLNHSINHVKKFFPNLDNIPKNLQLAIGGGTLTISPLELSTAFSTFANGGYAIQPYIIKTISTNYQQNFYTARPMHIPSSQPLTLTSKKSTSNKDNTPNQIDIDTELNDNNISPQIISPRNAFIMRTLLKDTVRYGTAKRAKKLKRSDLAGKTGTTDKSDTWFVGFNDALVTSVWIGKSNNSALGRREYGSNGPLPIWINYMQHALQDIPEKPLHQPNQVVSVKIDKATGKLPTADTKQTTFDFFYKENIPSESNHNNSATQRQINQPKKSRQLSDQIW